MTHNLKINQLFFLFLIEPDWLVKALLHWLTFHSPKSVWKTERGGRVTGEPLRTMSPSRHPPPLNFISYIPATEERGRKVSNQNDLAWSGPKEAELKGTICSDKYMSNQPEFIRRFGHINIWPQCFLMSNEPFPAVTQDNNCHKLQLEQRSWSLF